ncbi:streptococcal hemagglutinin isoform X1 [Pangasianodon hypophthalmus]|uniref:streptococcal hemagglutinin isoform X1 n=1 Tax=Pangasianodon hypophthalmus TaxID=310915 RepID=UPI002307AC03|nr:streptococcal hemagglutinin isoform X1 [Pangasianodon hypophthalmus]
MDWRVILAILCILCLPARAEVTTTQAATTRAAVTTTQAATTRAAVTTTQAATTRAAVTTTQAATTRAAVTTTQAATTRAAVTTTQAATTRAAVTTTQAATTRAAVTTTQAAASTTTQAAASSAASTTTQAAASTTTQAAASTTTQAAASSAASTTTQAAASTTTQAAASTTTQAAASSAASTLTSNPNTATTSAASTLTSNPNTATTSAASTLTSNPNTATTSAASTLTSDPNTATTSAASTLTSNPNTATTSAASTLTSDPNTATTSAASILTSTTNTPPSSPITTPISTAIPVAASFSLIFSINEVFVPALADTSSSLFLEKSANISNEVGPIYKKKFKNFLIMKILKFRSGSIVTESQLLFSSDGPTVSSDQVTSTFTSGLSELNFAVDQNSITVTQESGTTNATTTISPPVVAASFSLIFSINETFVPALADTSSALFLEKSANISNEVVPLYKKDFDEFIRMEILILRNGSIVTESILFFGPNAANVTAAQVKNTLLNGLKNLTFTVDPNSIRVTQIFGNSMPPVIASSLSVIWMSLLSLLLSVALHF